MIAKIGMVVGTARSDCWSQVQRVNRESGTVVVLVSLKYVGGGEGVDLASVGASLLENMITSGTITEMDRQAISRDISLSVLIVQIKNDLAMIRGVGAVRLYIERDGKMGILFDGGTVIEDIEGVVKSGDRLFVSTTETVERIGLLIIKNMLVKAEVDSEELAVRIHGQSNSSGMAASIVDLSGAEKLPELRGSIPSRRMIVQDKIKAILVKAVERIISPKPIFISEEKRSKNLWIGSLLLVLLIVGIGVGMVRRSRLIEERSYMLLEQGVKQNLGEARSIGDLNPERAKILIRESENQVQVYLKKITKDDYKTKAKKLGEMVVQAETEIFKKQEVNLTTLSELAVIKKDLGTNGFALGEQGTILLSDTGNERIVGISTVDKSIVDYSTKEVGKTTELAVFNKKIYALTSSGVARVTQAENALVIQPDELWKDVQLMDMFAGNVYLLDKGQSEVWKYPALTNGFGTRKRWLAPGIQPDLSGVIDMKVDGDVWGVTVSGKLVRYSRGVPVNFAMEGLPSEGDTLHEPKAIFLSDNKVFVLEKGESRILVFGEESGKYERQYNAEELGKAKDLIVYDNKAYVLLDDRIAWFGL